MKRVLVCVVVLGLLAGGCGRFARRGSVAPEPTDTTVIKYGENVPTKAPEVKKVGKTGTLKIRVIDDANHAVVGAMVRYKGEKSGRVATNSKGVASVQVPQGTYTADIAPCGTRVITKDYRSAQVFVPRGGVAGGDLDQIRWERRFQPTASVVASPDPAWAEGVTVDIGVRIEDRCSFEAAPRASVPEFAWRVSDPFVLRAAPAMRADGKGFAHVKIACKASGNGKIEIYDRQFPKNVIDVISALSVPAGGKFCA